MMQWIIRDIDIGHNLQELRKRIGYSQSEVETKLSLSGSTLSRNAYGKIELGHRNIKASDIVALKYIFDATYEEIFEGISPK